MKTRIDRRNKRRKNGYGRRMSSRGVFTLTLYLMTATFIIFTVVGAVNGNLNVISFEESANGLDILTDTLVEVFNLKTQKPYDIKNIMEETYLGEAASVSTENSTVFKQSFLPTDGEIIVLFGYDEAIFNRAIEIKTESYSPVRAAAKGTVTDIKDGKYVEIDHGNGFSAFYEGISSSSVTNGQRLEAGQTIGTMGENTVLKFRLMYNGRAADPLTYFDFNEN